jgi:mannose-6-phosphate isomerase-like protein (cupin superfamily)
MDLESRYSMNTDIKYGPLELIDVDKLQAECREKWFNQTLCPVNDCVVRLGVVAGEFHWHKHDREDEFFYVVDGRLMVDLKDQTFELTSRQGLMVPRGVLHRTRSPERSVILMIEGNTVKAEGD